MQDAQLAISDRMPAGKRLVMLTAFVLAVLLLALLLSRGTAGGDEGGAIHYAAWTKTHGWRALLAGANGEIAAHRLFWVGEKYLLDGILTLLIPAWAYGKPLVHDALMTLDGSLFMVLSAGIAGQFAARRHGGRVAVLAVTTLLLGSSAISFFVGGSIECMMLFFVTILTVTLHGKSVSRLQSTLALACGFFLIASKAYALVVLVPLALLVPRRAVGSALAVVLVTFAAGWLLIPMALIRGGGAVGLYVQLLNFSGIAIILGRVAAQFTSFAFGLIWCFPLLAVAAVSWRQNRKSLLVKSAALLALIGLLAMFTYPFGQGAVAGPRYCVPFLMIFLPEVADGVALLRRRKPGVLMAMPFAVLLFLPSLDYHNSLIARWLNVPLQNINWTDRDVGLQPGIFAWRVVAAHNAGAANFRPSTQIAYDVPMKAVFPMTGLSRVVYVLENGPHIAGDRSLPLLGWLWRHGMAMPLPWRILRALLALALLSTVGWAAWPWRPSRVSAAA